MSRALSSASLAIAALTVAASVAHAEPRRSLAMGQGPVAVNAANPSAAVRPEHRRVRIGSRIQPLGFFTDTVWRSPETIVTIVESEPRRRPIRPLSGNPVDPGAVVSRTPSGRVVIGPPPGYILPMPLAEVAQSSPYAPPTFHIIGAPSTRHMGTPVKLTHGVKPPEAMRLGPKVVWLDARGAEPDDAGGRIKRIR